jgi:hypothetical protein
MAQSASTTKTIARMTRTREASVPGGAGGALVIGRAAGAHEGIGGGIDDA